MGILPALFSLHYNVTRVRADGGDPDFARWGQLRNALAAREALLPPQRRLLARIQPLESAVATLDAFFKTELPALRTTLAASRDPEQRPDLEQRVAAARRAEQQAVAVLAEATYFLETHQNVAKADQYWKLLHLLNPGLQRVLKNYPDIANNGFGAVLPGVLTFDWTQRTVDCAGATTVAAAGTNSAPASPFHTYAVLSDPAVWSVNNPNAFKQTYPADTNVPVVTNPPTPVLRHHRAGHSWKAGLFEDADMAVIPDESPTEFRNVLNITFHSDDVSAVDLAYSLYESLTTSFFGIQAQGGIDVDSGTGTVGLTPGRLALAASKSIRFSEACPFSEFFNVIALPWLTWWMSDLVLLGLAS